MYVVCRKYNTIQYKEVDKFNDIFLAQSDISLSEVGHFPSKGGRDVLHVPQPGYAIDYTVYIYIRKT